MLEAKFEKYNSVVMNFQPFFNAEELEQRFERKANHHHLIEFDDKKADKTDITNIYKQIMDFNDKLEHVSVFMKELSSIIIPQKEGGQFTCNEDLSKSLIRRKALLK